MNNQEVAQEEIIAPVSDVEGETEGAVAKTLADQPITEMSLEEIEAEQQRLEKEAEEQAHLQLATNIANIILHNTNFLPFVTKHVTTAIIHTSAMVKQGLDRPVYVINRENLGTHTFFMDIMSPINPNDPLATKIKFVFLPEGVEHDDGANWVVLEDLSVEIKALLMAQAITLGGKSGDRFYGHTYASNPQAAVIDKPTDALDLDSGTEPNIALSDDIPPTDE